MRLFDACRVRDAVASTRRDDDGCFVRNALKWSNFMGSLQNFMERINLSYMINPLSYTDTREMIHFRLERAGYKKGELFTEEAISLIYNHSKGSPRKITLMCHHALELLIMHNRTVVEKDTLQELIASEVT